MAGSEESTKETGPTPAREQGGADHAAEGSASGGGVIAAGDRARANDTSSGGEAEVEEVHDAEAWI